MMTAQYSEKWCEQYCSDTVKALRDEMWDMDGDFNHELAYPDEDNPSAEPTITHEVCWLDPATEVDFFVWTPGGWSYRLHQDRNDYSMGVAVDEEPAAFAIAARDLCERFPKGGAW